MKTKVMVMFHMLVPTHTKCIVETALGLIYTDTCKVLSFLWCTPKNKLTNKKNFIKGKKIELRLLF